MSHDGVVFSSISAHVVPLFQGLGFTGERAVTFAALIGPSQVASRIGEIMLGRKLKSVHLGVIAFGLLPVALALFAAGGFSPAAALVFALLYGASNGLVTIVRGALVPELFGRAHVGRIGGAMSGVSLVLRSMGPVLVAVALLWLPGYAQAVLMMAGLGALSALAFMGVRRPVPPG
ncbi:MAG: hypothetical protein ACOVOG_01075 [Rubrivivax sp.]